MKSYLNYSFKTLIFLCCVLAGAAQADENSCANISLNVLGSGGPELDDGRNSSGFAVVIDGKARILVDTGMGTSREFERQQFHFNDVQAILLTHLHVDHVNDLAVYVKGSFFTGRNQKLPVLGPLGNEHLPSTTDYVETLLGKDGLYPYLRRHLPKNAGRYDYSIEAISASDSEQNSFAINDAIQVSSLPTSHGVLQSLAWLVDVNDCRIAFMGDTGIETRDQIAVFAKHVDLFVLNMPLEIDAHEPLHSLHMPPKDLAKLVEIAKPKAVLLAHLMKRSIKNLDENATLISNVSRGPVVVSEDGMMVELADLK